MAHNSDAVQFKIPVQETFEESKSIDSETDVHADNPMQETQQHPDIGQYRVGSDGTVFPPQSITPDLPPAFPHNRSEHPSASAESVPSPEPCKENRIGKLLQDKLNQSTDRAGLCVICSCTHPPGLQPIENSSSSEKMTQCFGMELGYLTHRVDDMSSHSLESLLLELTNLKIPEACSKDFRLLFSFFGHGNAEEICLSDGNVKRLPIIETLQKMSRVLIKIILFDCCRTDPFPVTMSKPIPETQKLRDMGGGTTNWEMKSYSPRAERVNTLVIYATDLQCKAYYSYLKGCGLVTYHFTELASTLDKPLLAMLSEVRKEVDMATQQEEPFKANISQVLDYNERIMGAADINLLAESKGSRRIAPSTPKVSISGFSAQIGWKISESVEKRIKCVYVKLNGEEIEVEMKGLRLANISLKPNKAYTTSVVAVYEDDVKAESEKVYFKTPDLGCAEICSLRLIKLFPLEAILEWQMDSEQTEFHIDHFTVNSDHGILVRNCKELEREAQLFLNPGTKYTMTVETHYSGKIMSSSKREFEYTTPTIDDITPIVEIPEEPISNSVIVKVSNPPIFQKLEEFHADSIELEKSFRIRHSQVGDEKNSGRYEYYTILHDELNHDPTQPHRVKLAGLQVNTRYKVDCEMNCSSRDVLSCQEEFDSEPSRKQWMCCSVLFPLCLLLLFLLSTLLFGPSAFSSLPYKHYLHGNTDTKTHLAQQNDTVQCGSGNSLQDEGITVQAVLIGSDTLAGTLIVAVTPQHDLKLYSKEWTPYIMNKTKFLIPFQLLPIDDIPLWVGSIVSGYFCIENPNDVEQNATMYGFINKTDADLFQTKGIAKNYVLSESIKIPPLKREYCFQNLHKGIKVNTSGYHYFVIHVSSSNMTFRYNATVLQKHPDINDYDNQKTFTCGSDGNTCTQGPTYLPFPKRSITQSETVYIAICKAPLESTTTSHINQTYNLNVSAAPTIHILSKVVPHRWMKPLARASTALGIIGLTIVSIVFLVVCCVACVCYRKRIFCNGYTCTCKYPCQPEHSRGYAKFHNPP